MVIKTYKCNLCTETKAKIEILGYRWKMDVTPQRYILEPVQGLDATDKHICKECIEIIKSYKPISSY